MKGLWKCLAAVLALAGLQGCATSMLTAPCDDPGISNSNVPFVYLVRLPYLSAGKGGPPSPAHQAAIRTLNELSGLEAIRMGAETTDMHVTLLEDRGQGCGIEPVYRRFAPGGPLNRRVRHSVVFYWGEVFEDGAAGIVVQSHVRVLWKGEDSKTLHVDLDGPDGPRTLRFSGHVPYATLSFPPRALPVGPQAGGGAALRSMLGARVAPREDAAEAVLPDSFTLVERRDGWVAVQGPDRATPVWVSVRSRGNAAKSILPELSFAHALAAYVNYRAVGDASVARDARRWLDAFREGYGAESSPLLRRPIAMADVLEAALLLSWGWTGADERRHARQLLDGAAAVLPDSGAVQTLAAMAQLPQCCTSRAEAQAVQDRLERARHLDAGNPAVARNLLNWYRLLELQPAEVRPGQADELRERTRSLQRLMPP